MKLFADSGSSKTDWLILEGNKVMNRFQSIGINPCILNEQQIREILIHELLPHTSNINILEIEFYGAGCRLPFSNIIKNVLSELTNCNSIVVESDMLGAAKMCCSNQPGIVCILGTGSNSCLFDGKAIIQQIPSLGFILGDEGSGGALGKRLVNAIFKGYMPKNICENFYQRYQLTYDILIQKVYREERPNKYLASFTHFIKENIENEDIKKLVLDEFNLFIEKNILPYHRKDLPIHFVGSVAFHFKDLLVTAVNSQGMTLGNIISHPIDCFVRQLT